MKKILAISPTFFSTFYVLVTILSGCAGWTYPTYRSFIFQIWFQVTAAIYIFLSAKALRLLIQLLKLRKRGLKNFRKHR